MVAVFQPSGTDIVESSLRGLEKYCGSIVRVHRDPLYVQARNISPVRRVALVSGGGSGHEPMHAGFVGQGMLDAAVPGRVFASPHNTQIYEASKSAALAGGVLHIVKNYTGDKINFGIAAERLRSDGITVSRVLVDDDIATDRADNPGGRRGTGATVIVEKLLGAAADEGRSLDELEAIGSDIARNSRSLAVAARAHTRIDTGQVAFTLEEGHLEFGVGIHGERAASSIAAGSLNSLVSDMTTRVLDASPPSATALILVNGLGGVSNLELFAIFDLVETQVTERGMSVAGSLVGSYCTALDMKGFSITITKSNDLWTKWFHSPVQTSGWCGK